MVKNIFCKIIRLFSGIWENLNFFFFLEGIYSQKIKTLKKLQN